MDHFFHVQYNRTTLTQSKPVFASLVACCVLSVCLTGAGLIERTGQNCCLSACPDKGQEKDGDES